MFTSFKVTGKIFESQVGAEKQFDASHETSKPGKYLKRYLNLATYVSNWLYFIFPEEALTKSIIPEQIIAIHDFIGQTVILVLTLVIIHFISQTQYIAHLS